MALEAELKISADDLTAAAFVTAKDAPNGTAPGQSDLAETCPSRSGGLSVATNTARPIKGDRKRREHFQNERQKT